MSAFLEIVKELTGEVSFIDAITKFTIKQLQEDATLFLNNEKRGGIRIVDKTGEEINIQTENILRTSIAPALPVNFTGDSRALYELLEADFFYNLVNPSIAPTTGVYDEIYTIEDYIQQTNNTTTYINSLTLPVTLSIGETYKFNFNYSLQVSRTNRSGLVRCYIESPTSVETQVNEMITEMKDNSNYMPFCAFRYITATEAGVHNVKIDFRCELGGTVVRIKDQTIEVLKKA
jgi:hypothetical protein